MMNAMQNGKIARVEELTRIPADVQDTLITILSEKTLPVPELGEEVQAVKDDAALLKGLPKRRVVATWIPWTYSRLAFASGYGAGIASPGWYDFLWTLHKRDGSRSPHIG